MITIHYLILLLYAFLKAFLPLPSLEVMLIPMVVEYPSEVIVLSGIGAIGTFIGGSVGYYIAYFLGNTVLSKITSHENISAGMELIRKHGIWAIFIGGITPIPDFILSYLAGLVKMNYWMFALSDALARLLRSLIVSYAIVVFGYVIDMDKWGSLFSLVIILYFILKWGFTKEK